MNIDTSVIWEALDEWHALKQESMGEDEALREKWDDICGEMANIEEALIKN